MGNEAYEQVAPTESADVPKEKNEEDLPESELLASTSNQTSQITIDDAIERIGMGPFQLYIMIAAGLCFAADAMQVMLLSFLGEVLKLEWGLSDDETALITSILFFGAIFGTMILGPLADRRGRRPVFLAAALIISCFGMLVSFVTNYFALLALLFMVGFGIGGVTVPFDILSEVLPAASRGKNLLMINYLWTFGVLLVVAFAHTTLADEEANWRLFVILCALPCFSSVIVCWYCVPESPRWLCTQEGRSWEALEIMRKAAEVNRLDAAFLFPEGTELLTEEKEEESKLSELLSTKWRWTTLKLWGVWFTFAFGYYGTIMVITEIFDSENESTAQGDEKDIEFDYSAIFVSSSAELIGTTFALFTVDTLGRIPLQIVSYALAGISVCTLCILAGNGTDRGILIAFSFTARIFEMVGSSVSWASTAEILTTDVRTTGHSAANAMARIGSILAPFLIEGQSSLMEKGLVMLSIHSVTILCVSQLPETKGSRMGRVSAEVTEDLSLKDGDENQLQHDDDHSLT